MKKLLFLLLLPSILSAQTFWDDSFGSTETTCFNIKNGDSIKYSVTCNATSGFGCSFSMGIRDCKTDKFTGASAFVRAKNSQTKRGSFVIRKSGRFYLKAVMGGAWTASVKRARR